MSIEFKDCFLHFLDRELLETQGAYNRVIEESISRDVRFILLNSPGDLILSASFLFESKYAYAIFEEFYNFFVEGKFVIAITYDSIIKMVSAKQEQYKGKASLFPNYFNNLWHVLAESGVMFVPKKENTTIYIANEMLDKLQVYNLIEEKSNIPYLQEVIEERGKMAITHHLFDPVYQKQGVSERDQDAVNTLITECYIRSYMEYFDATIPAGLICGIYTYDYLSNNAPLADITFWVKLYKQIGLYRFVCTCPTILLEMIIKSDEQLIFLHSIEVWVSSYEKKYRNPKERIVSFNKLINKLNRYSDIFMQDYNLYIKRIQIVTDEIQKLNKSQDKERCNMEEKEKTVFVVHGRNMKIKQNVFIFLRSLNVRPLEWESAVKMTNKGAPTTLEVIKAGMKNSNGIIVLFTGDDLAKLKEEFWEAGENFDFESQPRQNVLIEAGMAMALYPDSTIIVRIGKQRDISDFAGINYINLNNQPEKRQAFVSRLKTIGIKIDDSGCDWLSVGDFNT